MKRMRRNYEAYLSSSRNYEAYMASVGPRGSA